MTLDKARFESGLTYEAYKAGMSRNRERLDANEQRVQLDPEAVRFFRSLPRPINVVVVDFPFVPVIAITLASRNRQANSSSPMTSIPRAKRPSSVKRSMRKCEVALIDMAGLFAGSILAMILLSRPAP